MIARWLTTACWIGALYFALFADIARPATICQSPVLSPDGTPVAGTPVALDDPCRGTPVFAIPGAPAEVWLSDNVLPDWSDYDFDIAFALEFNVISPGIAGVYAHWIGEATAHDVWAKVNGTLVQKIAGWQYMGSSPVGAEIIIRMIDNTQGEDVDSGLPTQRWVRQDIATTETPEPLSAALVACGVVFLGVRRWRRG
jgi:hypothetical protein